MTSTRQAASQPRSPTAGPATAAPATPVCPRCGRIETPRRKGRCCPPVPCPACGQPLSHQQTSYGLRSACPPCGLHGWNGKPVVSQEAHDLRRQAHDVFDPIWLDAPAAYPELDTRDPGVVRKLRRITRQRAYHMLAFRLGLREPDVHLGRQDDPAQLRRIIAAAQQMTPQGVRDWWRQQRCGTPAGSSAGRPSTGRC